MERQNHGTYFGATDIGLTRIDNEDSFFIDPERKLFVVADGMGGHKGGKTASRYAIKQISDFLSPQRLDILAARNILKLEDQLVTCLTNTSERIYESALADHRLKGMGTTAVVAIIIGNLLHIAHVGDSRAYLYSNDKLRLLTTDHSYVNYLVYSGELTPEEAMKSPFRSKLTQALGMPRLTKPEYGAFSIKENDMLLLCSDGLWGMLPDDQIFTTLRHFKALEQIVEKLIHEAIRGGGEDNITAVIYRHQSHN